MSDEVLDDVMIKGNCKGKADAIVNCQCNIETAPSRCDQAEQCMFYSYYKCSKQWKPLYSAQAALHFAKPPAT